MKLVMRQSRDGETEIVDLAPADEPGIIEHLYRSHGVLIGGARRDELLEWKRRAYEQAIDRGLPPFPGALEFVQRAATRYALAIASGSMHREVELLLNRLELRGAFAAVTGADDCERTKPDPEAFFRTLARLQQLPRFEQQPLSAAECLVIEDAPHGILAAHRAGMRCLALSHSLPPEKLQQAVWVYRGFAEVDLETIVAAFA